MDWSSKQPSVLADAFVTILNAAGSSLLFSTYHGWTGDDFGLGPGTSADSIP
jgi:hypothetical protein